MDVKTKRDLIKTFEEINERIKAIDDLKSFGTAEVTCNPASDIALEADLPRYAGLVNTAYKGNCLFAFIQTEAMLGRSITFDVVNKPREEPADFIATTWNCATRPSNVSISCRDALCHPLLLSWEKFLSRHLGNLTSGSRKDDTYQKLTGSHGIPVTMTLDQGIDLMKAWVSWMETYTATSNQ